MGAADIDDDAVLIKLVRDERGIDHEGRAVQGLRRTEHLAPERMCNHDVVADLNGEHVTSSG